jgi:hypothetical protein
MMVKQCIQVLALMLLQAAGAHAAGLTHGVASRNEIDAYPGWRAAAARVLAARGDANSLATAAALTFLGPPSRSKADAARAASAALALAVKASELAPANSAISWLRLQLCTGAPGCDLRETATIMRWVAADNGVAWIPTLAVAQKEKDTMEVDRVLDGMSQGVHFDLYGNRMTVMMFDALRKARRQLPANYLKSDLARMTEAIDMANAAVVPSFSPLINACREAGAGTERRETCLTLAGTMQRADAVMAQLVGFAIEKRLGSDARELRAIAERRRLLEWRVAAANQADSELLPWLANARARSRIEKMRAMPREEDVCIAILREHKKSLEPPEDRR